MIRPTTPGDQAALLSLCQAAGLFEPHELDQLTHMLTDHFTQSPNDISDVWLTDEDHGNNAGPVGVAYIAPERMTEGTWNLLLIAIHPDQQKQGRGSTLLKHVEQSLIKRGERMLLVETLGLDDFDYVRRFYLAHGYEKEAVIRDYYGDGLDKIVFRKILAS